MVEVILKVEKLRRRLYAPVCISMASKPAKVVGTECIVQTEEAGGREGSQESSVSRWHKATYVGEITQRENVARKTFLTWC